MQYNYFLSILISGLLLQSCATILYGPSQNVSINSNPTGADVYVNGQNTGKQTPANIKVKKQIKQGPLNAKNEIIYSLQKEGFHNSEYRDNADYRALFLYVDFVYGVIPGVIDVATGSHLKYKNHIYMNMNKKEKFIQKEIVYVPAPNGNQAYRFEENSDVDKNIPQINHAYENRYALIIGNEDYSSHQLNLSNEVNVDFARNDASAFKAYAENVLGIPSENIIFMLDATTGIMNQGIAKANRIIKVTGGKAEFFVYYAGHGLPNDQTKEPYIMPVDVSGSNASAGVSLKSMYEKLTEYPSKKVVVFIDACFSGGARNQGLIAARGVKIQPRESPMSGNLLVFSASSGNQTSLPYKEKSHGFFTYFLLKKLQESAGKLSYNELSNYLVEKVSLKSVLINDKEQSPKVNVSSESQHVWKEWKINE